MAISSIAPDHVAPGGTVTVSYSYGRAKDGRSFVALSSGPPGGAIFAIVDEGGNPGNPSQPWIAWMQQNAGLVSYAGPAAGMSGTVTLTAPSSPGQYHVETIVPEDGGTNGHAVSLVVTTPVSSPPGSPPPATGTPPPPAGGTPAPPGPGLGAWLGAAGPGGLPHGAYVALAAIAGVWIARR
jgi:hypothetical protein